MKEFVALLFSVLYAVNGQEIAAGNGGSAGSSDPSCPATGTVNVPHPELCYGYLKCQEGYLIGKELCDLLQRFDPVEGCINVPETECRREEETPVLISGMDGIYWGEYCPPTGTVNVPHPNPEWCSTYLKCEEGQLIGVEYCDLFHRFDSVEGCVSDPNTECPRQELPVPISDGVGPIGMDGIYLGEYCPPTGTVNVPHPNPEWCATYLKCEEGQLIGVEYCDPFHRFDPVEGCVSDPDYECPRQELPIPISDDVGPIGMDGIYLGEYCPPTGTVNVPHPNPQWCSTYLKCEEGNLIGVEYCEPFQRFDPVEGCVSDPDTECPRPDILWTDNVGANGGGYPPGSQDRPPNGCPPTGNAIVQHPDACYAYLKCQEGMIERTVICDVGQRYDAATAGCVAAAGTECSRQPNTPLPMSVMVDFPEQNACPPTGDVLIAHPAGCYFYIECSGGSMRALTTCAVGQWFDPLDGNCKAAATETECQRPADANQNDAGCPATGTVTIQDSWWCYLYWICQDGHIVDGGMCPIGQWFDAQAGICKEPASASDCRREESVDPGMGGGGCGGSGSGGGAMHCVGAGSGGATGTAGNAGSSGSGSGGPISSGGPCSNGGPDFNGCLCSNNAGSGSQPGQSCNRVRGVWLYTHNV